MPGRRLRIAFVALAVWSVLFAPGMGDGAVGEPAEVRAQRLAAAVVAPTVDAGALVTSVGCRRDAHDVDGLDRCDVESVGLVATPVPVLSAAVLFLLRRRSSASAPSSVCRLFRRRGPPLS